MCVEKVTCRQAVCSDGNHSGGRRPPYCHVRITLSEATALACLAHALLLTRENSGNDGQGFLWIPHSYRVQAKRLRRIIISPREYRVPDEHHRIKGKSARHAQFFKTIGFIDALGDVDGRSAPPC